MPTFKVQRRMWPVFNNGMACAYCGRRDQPDACGHCRGCGATHPPSIRIDVTTIGDCAPRALYVATGHDTPRKW